MKKESRYVFVGGGPRAVLVVCITVKDLWKDSLGITLRKKMNNKTKIVKHSSCVHVLD